MSSPDTPPGADAAYGTPGATRPDFHLPEQNAVAELKQYDLQTQRAALVKNTAGLAAQRKPQLPTGTRQLFTIDLTNQRVTQADIDQLRHDIVTASAGALTPDDLDFRTD